MNFNTTTSVFGAEFTVDTSIDQPSIIYWNKQYYYPLGFNFKLYNRYGQLLTLGDDYTLDLSTINYAKVKVINSLYNGQTIIV
jgi:hypothetical protein